MTSIFDAGALSASISSAIRFSPSVSGPSIWVLPPLSGPSVRARRHSRAGARARMRQEAGPAHRCSGQGRCSGQPASALAFIWSNSAWVMVPLVEQASWPSRSARLARRRPGSPPRTGRRPPAAPGCPSCCSRAVAPACRRRARLGTPASPSKRQDDHEQDPERLAAAAEILAAEDVREDPEQAHEAGEEERELEAGRAGTSRCRRTR